MTAFFVRFLAIVCITLPSLTEAAALKVVTDNNYPPYIFRNADGEIAGYTVDLWRLWEKKTGKKVELTATNWADAQKLLLSGQADVIDMIFRTGDREALYEFSPPYATVPVAIYADASISGIYNTDQLKGFEIGVQEGDACVEKLRGAGISNLRLFSNYKSLIDAASVQDVKIFCLDEYPANYYLYQVAQQRKLVKAFEIYKDQFRRAVKKGNTSTLATVNDGMALISDKEKAALRDKWMGQPLVYTDYARKFGQVLLVLLALLLMMGGWLWSLRQAVKRRTTELEREKAQLNALVENSPDFIWLKDIDGKYLACNERAARLIGKAQHEVVGKTDHDLFDRASAEYYRQNDRLALESDGPVTSEESVTFPDNGEQRVLDSIKTVISKANGEVLGILGVARDITERKRNQQKLIEQDELLKDMSAIAKIGGWEFTPSTGSVQWTEEVARIVHDGSPKDSDRPFQGLDVFRAGNRNIIEGAIHQAISQVRPYDVELEITTDDGKSKWVRVMCRPVVADGKVVRVRGTIQDVTERRKLEESMRMAGLIYQTSTDAIVVTDENNSIVNVNPAFTRQTGYELDEVVGKNPRIFKSGKHDRAFYEGMWRTLLAKDHWNGEIWDRSKDGTLHVSFLNIRVIRHPDGRVYRYVAQYYDVTEQKQKDELIWTQSNFDALTGLPNRRLFLDQLEQAISGARDAGKTLALMFIDLDRFKEVNDTLGYIKGDSLLVDVSQRIRECVGGANTLARTGGDEFTIIIQESDERIHLDRVAREVVHAISAPYHIDDGLVGYLSGSVGISLYPQDGDGPAELLNTAEQAMYLAKREGGACFNYFTKSLQNDAWAKLLLTNELRQALARDELRVYYQPIVDVRTGIITKAEALLRWIHPTQGMISPAVFIPLAEECGLISSIGDWVFQEAIANIERWRNEFGFVVELSVNKSPAQFEKPQGCHWLDRVLQTGLPASCITVEITEGLLLHDSERVKGRLKKLQEAGVKVSIDDFGTGFSALSYLKHFDIDYLKIDKSFIDHLIESEADQALTEAIIGMAHKLNIKTIAEGVETIGQRDMLAQFGCDYIQGYFYSRPVPVDEFEALLARQSSMSPLELVHASASGGI